MLNTQFKQERRENRKFETHFNPSETLFPRSSVQLEACDIASWQISFVKGTISFGQWLICVISGIGSCGNKSLLHAKSAKRVSHPWRFHHMEYK